MAPWTINFLYPWALKSEILHYGKILQADNHQNLPRPCRKKYMGLLTTSIESPSLPPYLAMHDLFQLHGPSNGKLPSMLIVVISNNMASTMGSFMIPSSIWSTIHLALVLSLFNNFKSRQADFVQAFTQAPRDCPVIVKILVVLVNGTLHITDKSHKRTDKT